MLRSCIHVGLIALVGAAAVTAHADERRFRSNDIRAAFAIAESTNRNEVHYGVKLDDDCQPIGNEPVFAYWRDFEKGPEVTDDLSAIERSLRGSRPEGARARVGREQDLDEPEGDPAGSVATIDGAPARLKRVFVHVAGIMSVDWIELRGLRDGQPAVERVQH